MTAVLGGGLAKTERAIYGALLTHGKLHLTGISRATGIKKTTLYLHLESLLKQDLIRRTVLGKRTYYYAENPRLLLTSLTQQVSLLEKDLPRLLELYAAGRHEPQVTLYTGRDAFTKAITEAMRGSLETKNFWSPRRYLQTFSMSEDKFDEIAKQEGVRVKILLEHDSESERFLKIVDSTISTARMLSKEYSDLPLSVIVGNGKLALMSYDDLFCLVIHNRVIASFIELLFDNLWKQSK